MITVTLPARQRTRSTDSEGARSARRICSEVPEARSQMPQPYLLTPAGAQVVGNSPRTPRKAHPPLRLIRTSEAGPACGCCNWLEFASEAPAPPPLPPLLMLAPVVFKKLMEPDAAARMLWREAVDTEK